MSFFNYKKSFGYQSRSYQSPLSSSTSISPISRKSTSTSTSTSTPSQSFHWIEMHELSLPSPHVSSSTHYQDFITVDVTSSHQNHNDSINIISILNNEKATQTPQPHQIINNQPNKPKPLTPVIKPVKSLKLIPLEKSQRAKSDSLSLRNKQSKPIPILNTSKNLLNRRASVHFHSNLRTKLLNTPIKGYRAPLRNGNDSGYDTDVSNVTADNEFGVDDESHVGHSLSPRFKFLCTPKREPFEIIGLNKIQKDLLQNEIIFHGVFKAYSSKIDIGSYLDVAGILTANRLYFADATKYQIWQEFVTRSRIDEYINEEHGNLDKNINAEMAAFKLIKNMNILDELRAYRLLPYLEGKTKKEIMLHMLLNGLPRDRTRKLSSYFHLDRDIDGYNAILDRHVDTELIPKEPSRDTKYIEITRFDEEYSSMLEYLLDDIEYIKEEIIDNSIVIELKDYHEENEIVGKLNRRKKQYFAKNGLKYADSIKIKEWTGYQIPYSFTEPKIIELDEYRSIRMTDGGILIEGDYADSVINLQMYSINDRDAWTTHLDYVLHKLQGKRDEEEAKYHEQKNKEEEDEHGMWYYRKTETKTTENKVAKHKITNIMFDEDGKQQEVKDKKPFIPNEHVKQKLVHDFDEKIPDDRDCNYYDKEDEFYFGVYLNYWQRGYNNSVIPKHDTLKQEFLKNDVYRLSKKQYYSLYEECMDKYRKKGFMIKARNVGVNNKKFNVKPGTPMSINHIMALKFYTDYTVGQKLFCEQCRRKNQDEKIEDLIRRNSEIAIWCRYLREATTFYGTEMVNEKETKIVYSGFKNKVVLSSLTQNFYCPISTSKDRAIAENYCEGTGVILKLVAAHGKSRYFNVNWISHYDWEEERFIMGARMRIIDIYIDGASHKRAVAALHLLERILGGYELCIKREAQSDLLMMLVNVFNLGSKKEKDSNIPEYIEQLLQKIVSKMKSDYELKKLWINEAAITRLTNKKLKCLFNGCNGCITQNCDISPGGHQCGQFFYHFGINPRDIKKVTQFTWKIDPKSEGFTKMNMKARKYITSPRFAVELDEDEVIENLFHLQCYPKHSPEFENCALFLHINEDAMPTNVASIKVKYDFIWKTGKKLKYQHVMIPQILSRNKSYCGCQTFPSKWIEDVEGIMEWKMAIRVIEVNYCHNYMENMEGRMDGNGENEEDMDDNSNKTEMSSDDEIILKQLLSKYNKTVLMSNINRL